MTIRGRRTAKPATEAGGASKGGGWWGRKITLTAILGGLGIVVTVLTQANQVIEQGRKLVGFTSTVSVEEKKTAGGSGTTGFEATVAQLTPVPYSLMNVTASNKFLNWFWLAADNSGPEPLHVALEVEVIEGPARRTTSKVWEYTIPGRTRKTEHVQPTIDFINSDFLENQSLSFIWRVNTTDGPPRRLDSGTITVQVLPREVVPWGLRSANGQEVPRDFLVASLAAWVYTPERAIEARAREIAARAGPPSDPKQRLHRFMQRTYEGLFPTNVAVHPDPQPFPPTSHKAVKAPGRALEGHRATALEAALLMAAHRAALGDTLQGRIVMLAVPASDQAADPKVFLLAWSIEGRDWEAVDLNQADKPFDANLTAATPRASAVLAARPDVDAALENTGVFVGGDQKLVALRFRRAQKHYGIRALP